MKTTTLKLLPLTALSVMAFAGQTARADFIFDLNQPNSSVNETGDFIQVDVHLTSSSIATITFTSLITEGNINLMAGTGAVGVNVNASSFVVGPVIGNNAGTGFTPGPLTSAGAANEDGFGSFNATIDSFDGFMHSSDMISFTLTDLDAGGWASANNVLTGNGQGELAAAHDFYTPAPAVSSDNNSTGFVSGNGTTSVIPDGGSTLIMLGTALIGVAKARNWLARS